MLHMIATSATRSRRPRGRPMSPTLPAHRRKCLKVAEEHILDGAKVAVLARRLRCSRPSVYEWMNQALQYPEGKHLLGYARGQILMDRFRAKSARILARRLKDAG